MDLSNILGGGGGVPDVDSLTSGLTQLVESHGGVDGLLAKLQAGGLGGAADSWISTGSNAPVEPQQLANALGPDAVNKLAASTGLDLNSLLPLLASLLPMVIDHLTPGGNLPKEGGVGDTSGIGGLISSVLGGGSGGLGGLLGGLGQG